jgi:hypothetical protein
MKKIIFILVFLTFCQTFSQTKPASAPLKKPAKPSVAPPEADRKMTPAPMKNYEEAKLEYAQTITVADMSRHLHILAADSMEGRNTGDRGQKMAAQYIGSHFFYRGLDPVVSADSGRKGYFQPFYLGKRSWGEVYVKNDKYQMKFLEAFFIEGSLNIPQEKEMEVVFGGYGIESDKHSDYAGLDLQGKAVLILAGEPRDKKGRSLVTGKKDASEWENNWKKKVAKAKEKGAAVVFAVMEKDSEFKEYMERYKDYLSQAAITYQTSAPAKDNAVFFTNTDMFRVMFNLEEKDLKKQLKRISKGKRPEIENAKVKIKAERKDETVATENVLGLVEGKDKKDEILVISAHYDHIGISADGQINNGADDDGSGTTTVLELAEAFARAKAEGYGPRRSILFLTVTGEEKGLFGSRYYTENPVFPLQNTIADLNIDMVGRVDEKHKGNPDYIYLIGSDKLSSELHKISEEENKNYSHLALDYTYNDPNDPNRFYYRSDHYNFARNGIPVIFYFNGVHEDYHMPTDDVEKINFQKMEKIGRLVFYTAWDLANREDRIRVDSSKK